MIFVIFPLAYFIARGNKTLVQNALHERLNSLSIIAESLERDIQNSRQEMNDLQKNRRLILEDAWRTKMRDMELTIAQKIQMGQSLIDSSSAKEKIKYQEHFLSLNHTLGLLKTIHSQMNQKIEAGLSDNVFEDLSRATQASFDAIIVAMENHILTLKNILEGIYLQRAKTTQALLQWNRR
jgi:hypothetical protein